MGEKTIANNLARYRKREGLTQLELANEINYSDKVISKWERGESLPGIEALKKISEFYGISVDEIIDNTSSFQSPSKSNIIRSKISKGPSKFFMWTMIIPVIFWGISIAFGPQWFVIGGVTTLLYFIIYSIRSVFKEYIAIFNGHEIKVVTTPISIKMFIDNVMVDSFGFPILNNYLLTGKIDKYNIKVKITLLFGVCIFYKEE